MKLYKLSVIVGNNTVERGVWASHMTVEDNVIIFRGEEATPIALFPVNLTFITSIETSEQVEERRKSNEGRLKNLTNEIGPR